VTSPINLNKARKAKARAEKRKTANANAVKFGRSKADKIKEAREQARDDRHLDGHKREP